MAWKKGTKGKVTVSLIILLSLLSISLLMDLSSSVDGAEIDEVQLRLKIQFDTPHSGHIDLYFGTGDERDLPSIDSFSMDIDNYGENLKAVYESFTEVGADNVSIFRSILHTDPPVNLSGVRLKGLQDPIYLGISFEANFTSGGRDTNQEYRILNFLNNIDMGDIEIGIGALKRAELERRFNSIKISIQIDLADGLSLDKDHDTFGHSRSPFKESLNEKTTLTLFSKRSNELTVSDHPLTSPLGVLITMIIVLGSGYILFFLIWRKNRFKGIGLILPFLTVMVSILVVVLYFLPHYSIYGFGGLTMLIYESIFLSFVAATRFVNPKFHHTNYEDEKKNDFKMPEVVYVEKTVYIGMKDGTDPEERVDDPYELLGVSKEASMKEVEMAYKKEILQYHPDKFDKSPVRIRNAASKETRMLNNAYEMIHRQRRK